MSVVQEVKPIPDLRFLEGPSEVARIDTLIVNNPYYDDEQAYPLDYLQIVRNYLIKHAIISPYELSLYPLTEQMLARYPLVGLFTKGFNNPSLRRGYIPDLPTLSSKISELLVNWSQNPFLCTYIVFENRDNGCDQTPFGYLKFMLSDTTGMFSLKPSVSAWVSYGNLNSDLGNKGLMSRALRLAVQGMVQMEDPYIIHR